MTALQQRAQGAMLDFPPITRSTLALYAGASGDHAAMHIDADAARALGMDDVLAHGMLVTGYLGRVLTEGYPGCGVRAFSVRYVSIVPVGAQLRCEAAVESEAEEDGRTVLRLALAARDEAGDIKQSGEATIVLPAKDRPSGKGI